MPFRDRPPGRFRQVDDGATSVMDDDPPLQRADPPPLPAPAALPLPYALPAALLGGVLLLAAFPPYGWWFCAPLGVAAVGAAVHRRRLRAGFGLGMLAGLAFFVPLLAWTNLHTGNFPWLLLSTAQAAILGLSGVALAWVSPLADRRRALWPLLTGLVWLGQEALRDRAPFGGFPWGRLAFSQGDAPLLRLAAYGGAPLVTFAVALVGGCVLAAAWRYRRLRPVAGFAGAAVALCVLPLLLPVGHGSGERVTVAVVQGNVPRLGLDFNAQRRAVLENHAVGTEQLAADVAAGRQPRPAMVIWPENSSDVDPLLDDIAAARISAAVDAIGVPVLTGTVLRGPAPGEIRNAGLLWLPGTGPDRSQVYVKRHPVPFAEYVPLRRLARLVSTQVDRVSADFIAGDTPGVMRIGPVVVGDVICFEVAYDDLVRDTVTGGAQLLAVQTNNATFNTAEAEQQLAMVQLRAVEHGRDALMASTVGVSALVDSAGRIRSATSFNTAAVVVGDMRAGGPRTLSTRLGSGPEFVGVALAVAALLWAGVLRRRARRSTPVRSTPTSPATQPEAR